jgi:transcriptional regulator with XRE-family HTH domain
MRERQGATQDELGRRAGYGAGAGVSISRLENGLVTPGPDKFAGVAKALGVSPDELAARAEEQSISDDAHDPEAADGLAGTIGASSHRGASPGSKGLKDRARRIQNEIDERTKVITELSGVFNKQHDRARDEFFMRFVEIASRVEGATPPDSTHLVEEDDGGHAGADAVAAYRLKYNANSVSQLLAGGAGGAAAGAAVGGAAAYGTFVAVASFGTASTGAAISGLTGVAATNATLALLGGGTLAAGGAGVAGGTMVLAGIVAAPAFILTAGGLIWMAKRNRKQQQELAAKLDEAEAELAATSPGVLALTNILPRATATLEYIATHAGHAVTRWEDQLGPGSLRWDSLSRADQQRYQDFIDIAAAQLAVLTINVQGLLTTRGSDLDRLTHLADEVLTQSHDAVTALV